MQTLIERARAYLAKMPASVEGQGGSTAAFNAAVALARGFNLTDADALQLLLQWNAGCLPPWSEAKLRSKLQSARTSSKQPFGYLLNDNDSTPPKTTPDLASEDERKARQRQSWPPFNSLTVAELRSVASLRKLPFETADYAAKAGFLCGAIVDDHKCFIIRDGTFAQARRLDGGTLRIEAGETKAKNLLGSQGAFIGHARWLGDESVNVLLIEGCVGLLEGIAAEYLAEPNAGWTVIAATSAGSRFHRDPELLAALAGRHVVIIPDTDDAGLDGASSWLVDLEGVSASVKICALPDGCKDLGPVIAEPARHQEFIASIFQ